MVITYKMHSNVILCYPLLMGLISSRVPDLGMEELHTFSGIQKLLLSQFPRPLCLLQGCP